MSTLKPRPIRKDDRIIIHFDYDCFYAACFEVLNPSLRQLPFAVQQKQIIVTCNYEARRRGLHKLQLIRDAKRICPDVIIELGEDISRFRDVSKELYHYIKSFSWNGKVERLGFDEVWLDVTDMIDYNMDILNRSNLESSFFQLVKDDPTQGFAFDATSYAGHTYPEAVQAVDDNSKDEIVLRLRLGSHLALYLRHELERTRGFTSTVGISTSKVLSKLVGNLHKPKGQTTLIPPLSEDETGHSNVTAFMDSHEIGKVPGIGFKMAQRLREHILQRPAAFDDGLVYGGTKEKVTVADVRTAGGINPESLEKLLGGPGSPHGIGTKIWSLIHGVDDSEVIYARAVPQQISIEDSYIRLDTLPEVLRRLTSLARSLLTRMRVDLLGNEDDEDDSGRPDADGVDDAVLKQQITTINGKKWLAHPRTLRLTTRPRPPLQPDGTRIRSFRRISHSAPLPPFVFNLAEHIDAIVERLVKEALVPMFHRLHPEKSGWNLSLVNLAVTNMTEAAGESKTASGRDISNMFKRQEDVLKDFRVTDTSPLPLPPRPKSSSPKLVPPADPVEDINTAQIDDTSWDDDGEEEGFAWTCHECGATMPAFAMTAHTRFHAEDDPF